MLFPFLKNWRATKVCSEGADVQSCQIELTKAKLEIENLTAKNDALRKELERSNQLNLKRQRERFLEIIRSMRDGLCVIDDTGFITFANPVAEKLFDSKNLIGENFFSFIEIE
jgi:PAS domain-containing protein